MYIYTYVYMCIYVCVFVYACMYACVCMNILFTLYLCPLPPNLTRYFCISCVNTGFSEIIESPSLEVSFHQALDSIYSNMTDYFWSKELGPI